MEQTQSIILTLQTPMKPIWGVSTGNSFADSHHSSFEAPTRCWRQYMTKQVAKGRRYSITDESFSIPECDRAECRSPTCGCLQWVPCVFVYTFILSVFMPCDQGVLAKGCSPSKACPVEMNNNNKETSLACMLWHKPQMEGRKCFSAEEVPWHALIVPMCYVVVLGFFFFIL